MEKHTFNPTILRKYDIRGIIGETLNKTDALAVGKAFGSVIVRQGGKSVCVGYDGRLSSPDLEAAMVEGLSECGLEVHRIGRGPTPMLYYATKVTGADAGVMITGSHNPPTHNGIKMVLGVKPFFDKDITNLGVIAGNGDFIKDAPKGKIIDHPIMDEYIDRLLEEYNITEELTVAWDPGNGASGEVVEKLTKKLPGKHILINEEIDGTFPNHHPDPTIPENLVQLQAAVKEHSADLGVAFDGDGDRIGAIDSEGRMFSGDQLLVVYAEDVLKTSPNSTIIADVKASQVFFNEVEKMGGKPLMWMSGHSLIKNKKIETGSPLAGEMSGHIFFSDRYYGFDDAVYAAVRLIRIVGGSGDSLKDRYDRLPKMVNTPEIRFECPEERKFDIAEEVKERMTAAGAEVNDIDGVRVLSEDGWWLLRASNTQAVLVVRCESETEEALERLKAQVNEQLSLSGIASPF
ncbi:MAG: phosphomannomutase/phosphoglucomutase [Alphaproteobacteria bacterium]|nr:phosphomannomutase/phosphoglucomutase [Alphaproteobacteria bacterium]